MSIKELEKLGNRAEKLRSTRCTDCRQGTYFTTSSGVQICRFCGSHKNPKFEA